MEKLEGSALETFEEHLLICAHCQDRVMDTDSFVRGMKAALAHGAVETTQKEVTRKEPWSWARFFQIPVPVWATGAVAVAGISGVFLTYNFTAQIPPLALALTATRSGTMTVAKVAGPLDLDLDARDLAPSGKYHVQIVNGDGTEVWSSGSEAHNGHVHALVNERLSPGQYYVRIADPTGAQREFALRLGSNRLKKTRRFSFFDSKFGRIGNRHYGHHTSLDRVAHHQVGCVRNTPRHIQTNHQ